MRKLLTLLMLVSMGLPVFSGTALRAAAPAAAQPPVVRELYVPFNDLNVLLDNQPRRVLLSRQEYEELLAKAKAKPQLPAPVSAAVLAANYQATVEQERARITGLLVVEVLESGLQAVGLDLAGVGLRRASLDGKNAAIGRADDGHAILFVEGKGLHQLELDLVAPLAMTAAQQVLDFRVPTPAATRLRLTVPGDVEIKSGMKVVSRAFDASAQQTRFELLPAHDKTTIVMTLNSRLLRKERVVVARAVLVDEVTQNYERLHATFSLAVLHRAVDSFRITLPAGFEVTQVHSPLLARWSVAAGQQDSRILEIRLREQTTEMVLVNVAAIRTAPPAAAWTFPVIKALDVAGEVAVVGLLLEDRMKAQAIHSDGLIPIDTSVLSQALPASVFQAEPGAPQIRPIVAYYAPQSDFQLAATFQKPPPRLLVTTNLLLTLAEKDQRMRGGFTLLGEAEKLFAVDLTVPEGWEVTSVTAGDGSQLPIERFAGRINVRLPQGVPPGQPFQVYFQAISSPAGWLADWTSTPVSFPVFRIAGATRETGAVAVAVQGDLAVRPENLEQLTPLDENEKERYGLAGVTTSLAYRFDGLPYQAGFTVQRVAPRLTAQTYSFLVVRPDVLTAHYEIVYDAAQAKVQRLGLALPASTPETLSIQGLEGLALKEYTSQVTEDVRHWSVLLEEARRETIRLAVDFQQPLAPQQIKDLALPVVRAENVAHQAGFVAIEGSAELDVKVATRLRKVDIGELVNAKYQPGKRLLGAYSFVGDSPDLRVSASRHPGHDLPSVLVERAELVTVLAAQGLSQNAARMSLRAKGQYLEVKMPAGAALWSAQLDGVPAKPQREDQRLLLDLPAGGETQLHDLQFVYEMPVRAVRFRNHVELLAPTLLLGGSAQAAGRPVPVADLTWHVHVPPGYRVSDTGGTVVTDQVPPAEPAITTLGEFLYRLSGGINFMYSCYGLARAREARVVTTPALSNQVEEYRRMGQRGAVTSAGQGGVAAPQEMAGRKLAEGKVDYFLNVDAKGLVVAQAPAAKSAQPPPPQAAKAGKGYSWALEGVSSLKIELQEGGERITFRSLGADPRVTVTLLNEHRSAALAWALACAAGLWGLRLVSRPVRSRVKYVLAIAMIATLVPLASGSALLTEILNPSFIVASLLVPAYLFVGLMRWIARRFQPASLPVTATAALVAVLILCPFRGAEAAKPPPKPAPPPAPQTTEPRRSVNVPADAIILPYDPASRTGIKDVHQMLVPYDKYVDLWNRAHPDERMTTAAPPAPYGLGGVALRTTLQGVDHLLIEGQVDVDVYAEGTINIPLPLESGVLVKADLDGQPAKLGVVRAAPVPTTQQAKEATEERRPDSVLVLNVSGKGRHHLALAAQMQLRRSGGWRVTQGRLLAAPAGTLTLIVPEAQTEVRLAGVSDRTNYLTTEANQTVETALSPDGRIAIQWRPKVSEGVVDQSLTAQSAALLDVQEDGLGLVWRVALEFRRTERESFRLSLPPDYMVTQVTGGNVRGWEVSPAEARQQLDITLLKPAKDQERFDVHLWRRGRIGTQELATFEVPVVTVHDAALHHGRLVIRRSPLLDLRTASAQGVTRTDLPSGSGSPDDLAQSVESPLGIRPFAAYKFAATPFSIRLTASPVPTQVTANAQAILRIGQRQRSLEARIILDVQNRSLYQVGLLLPGDLDLEQVSAPGAFEWTVTPRNDRKLLNIVLAAGQTGSVPILISGRLGQAGVVDQVALPQLEVLDVQRQEGDIVVQADPAFKVDATNLQQCESILLNRVHDWLNPKQRELARLALHYRSAGYGGQLRLVPLAPSVHCYTVSNARVTDRAIEETVLLDFTIHQAGIRELSFLLPENMKDARVNVPQLRLKTIEPASPDKPGLIRVRLQLQDKVLGQLRVLVENDRLPTTQIHRVPIPFVETGRTDQRYVLLESAGRDEVVVETQQGLAALERQQKEWSTLARILGTQITSAYIVDPGAQEPVLAFKTKDRAIVETVGARIGLAQGWMSVDASGTYRAVQVYRVDNSTEQFLEIRLPPGAELWTARVAGEPVKPTQSPDPAKSDHLLVPLVKTAAGDLDYEVVLKYGGQLPTPGRMSSVTLPLIRTVNINAESSQVRLYMPDRYHWFDFGGTMTRVEDEAALAAGVVAYQTKQAERLDQVMRGPSSFAQVRAAANLQVLQSEVRKYQQVTQSLGFSSELAHVWESNALIIAGAARQSEQVHEQLNLMDTKDNRGSLNRYYADQSGVRAGDAVKGDIANFAYGLTLAPPASQPAEGKARHFDEKWFFDKGLANPEAASGISARVRMQPQPQPQGGPAQQVRGTVEEGRPQQAPAQPPPPQVAQQQVIADIGDALVGRKAWKESSAKGKQAARSKAKDTLGQYQEALQAQAAQQKPAESAGAPQLEAARGPISLGGSFGTTVQPPATQPAMPSGLTSLDVDIPQVGVLYRFTSPRGEATITARAVSQSFTGALKRLGLAVLIAVVVWLIYKAVSLLAGSAKAGSPLGLVLIVVGIISLLAGVLPGAGLVLIALGLAARMRRRISQDYQAAVN